MIKGWQPKKILSFSKRPPNVSSGMQTPIFRKPVPMPDIQISKDMMWYVYDTPRLVKIYDITYNSNGYPLFLIYLDGQWLRKSAKYFRPKEK